MKEQETGSKNELKDIEQALAEIQYLKMIRNINVVRYRDFEFEKKKVYLLMEYCDGGNLQGFIRKQKQLEVPVQEKDVWKFLI